MLRVSPIRAPRPSVIRRALLSERPAEAQYTADVDIDDVKGCGRGRETLLPSALGWILHVMHCCETSSTTSGPSISFRMSHIAAGVPAMHDRGVATINL